ncbi:hypothetical protein [Frisingicoccus sp.]|uniref:hypothetical protein n=1 Tax=Frisingicoccus sp. TaxID=1918627 RepID=UPI003AB1DBF2
MKRNKQQSTFVNIGSSSLLIVFLVLCLTTFAILSLSSAQSDYSFSKRSAEHKTEYYEASSRAEMILGEIDQILAETAEQINAAQKNAVQEKADSELASFELAAAARLDGKEIDNIPLSCTGTEEGTVISYQVPSGAKQALNVSLLITNDSGHENYYKIQAWQLISTSDWNADNSLNLIPVE